MRRSLVNIMFIYWNITFFLWRGVWPNGQASRQCECVTCCSRLSAFPFSPVVPVPSRIPEASSLPFLSSPPSCSARSKILPMGFSSSQPGGFFCHRRGRNSLVYFVKSRVRFHRVSTFCFSSLTPDVTIFYNHNRRSPSKRKRPIFLMYSRPSQMDQSNMQPIFSPLHLLATLYLRISALVCSSAPPRLRSRWYAARSSLSVH